jgi:hypothetical protein
MMKSCTKVLGGGPGGMKESKALGIEIERLSLLFKV